MEKIAFFDTKPYDREYFDQMNPGYEIEYFDNKLGRRTARLAEGCDAVCAFVNDEVDAKTIERLHGLGVRLIAMRCAGYSNVDVKAAYKKLHIVRVPAYSPYAVAEHAMALILAVNRKLHKAFYRPRDCNFSLTGLTGFDLNGKTVGVIGTGKIGQVFIDICRGFGTRVLAYDPYPAKDKPIKYVDLDTLFQESDIISLHCPLTEDTKYILNRRAFDQMKDGVYIINTSRGGLIESDALLDALNAGKVGAAGLDVYEEESELFFEDYSTEIIQDDTLSLLLSRPNVLITSHQAFLTREALENIAATTYENLDEFFQNRPMSHEICYRCKNGKGNYECRREQEGRCF
ncbi:MAG: 2-hydroxyacid dehydrogenase [Clostridiales bacterium]|nr:2-hydroxyacid dehydrogenase [Clostridiales bacterium]